MSDTASITAVGLLSRDLLQRVTDSDPKLGGLAPSDYDLAPDERVRDQTARSWSRLTARWESFRQAETRQGDRTATQLTRRRWLYPLLQELGFGGIPHVRSLAIDETTYPISHQWGTSIPIHLIGWRLAVDKTTPGVPGAATRAPHSLMQEYLNRSDDHLWGIVTNGRILRVLRDNAAMTRLAYIEADLEAIFDGNRYAEFVLLWKICHRTRFEAPTPEQCILEQWNNEAITSGIRVLNQLRDGVENAIKQLGQGFLTHRNNRALQKRIQTGDLPAHQYMHQLLRLVYRMLFLLVTENRDLLHHPDTPNTARERYRDYYSMRRLRRLAAERRRTAHSDLWQSLQVTMDALHADGLPALGLPPLGSHLWSPDGTPDLNQAHIDNRHLLNAVHSLCYTRDPDTKALTRVDYRNLGTEELGSVYESLLELHPVINGDARTFGLAYTAGSERKSTGSYYTPPTLINRLLDDALNPILDQAVTQPDPEQALLALRILDPACGSGHFLIAAAHRIADRIARIRAPHTEPTPTQLHSAVREVIGRCVYGVDINPLAVELCKVALWLEANNGGQPLSFLDHHIVCGNSLLGATPELIEDGIPKEAFQKVIDDDAKRLTELRKANRTERKQRDQQILDLWSQDEDIGALADDLAVINAGPDNTVGDVTAKADLYEELQHSPTYKRAKLVADAWCSAFVAPKRSDLPAITDITIREIAEGHQIQRDTRHLITELSAQYQFLHPHITFPDIRKTGGFDLVVGNPPWGRIKFQEKKWFARRDPAVANAPNQAADDGSSTNSAMTTPTCTNSSRHPATMPNAPAFSSGTVAATRSAPVATSTPTRYSPT